MSFKLTHPDSTQEIEVVDAKQAAIYISQGWVSKPSAPNPPPVEGAQGAVLPAESTEKKD